MNIMQSVRELIDERAPRHLEETARAALELFEQQHGVATRRQLLAEGVTKDQLYHAVQKGRWVRLCPRVYGLASWPASHARWLQVAGMATGGVASHASAAWLWERVEEPPDQPEVSTPWARGPVAADLGAHKGGPWPGVVVHRSRDLEQAKVSQRRGIPVTNPLRTLVDLAAEASARALGGAVDRALSSRLVSVEGLLAEAARLRRRGRQGPPQLRQALGQRGFTGGPAASVLESRAARLFKRNGLVVTRREVVVDEGHYRLDFELEGRIYVEFDGYAYHCSPESKRYDDARRNKLRLLGYTVLVYDWWVAMVEPRRVVQDVLAAKALTAAG